MLAIYAAGAGCDCAGRALSGPDYFERARLLVAEYVETVAVLRRCGHSERSAVEAAGVLLWDRLTVEGVRN